MLKLSTKYSADCIQGKGLKKSSRMERKRSEMKVIGKIVKNKGVNLCNLNANKKSIILKLEY